MSIAGIYTVREEDEDTEDLVVQNAHELFRTCDKELKGFITKRDMQRLKTELSLTAEQLEEVFDTLDQDGSGALTLEEFRSGFAVYLGLQNTKTDENSNSKEALDLNETDSEKNRKDDEQFYDLLESLGARDVFGDENDVVKTMWRHLKKDDQTVMFQFENFLAHVIAELKRSQSEYSDLETVFRNRGNIHDAEVRKLVEEMEQAVESERAKLLGGEKMKERRRREELEDELSQKEGYVQELVQKQSKLERKLIEVNTNENEAKQENTKLQMERDQLEKRLAQSEQMLNELKRNVDSLKQSDVQEKRHRLKSALKASEGIAMEREGLVKQLDMLRNVNKQLLDEHDAVIEASRDGRIEGVQSVIPSFSDSGASSSTRSEMDMGTNCDKTEESVQSESKTINEEDLKAKIFNPFSGGRVDYEVDESFYPRDVSSSTGSYFFPDEKSEYSYVSFGSGNSDPDSSQSERTIYKGINPFLQSPSNDFHHVPLKEINLGKEIWKVKRSLRSDCEGDTQESWKVKLSVHPACNSKHTLEIENEIDFVQQESQQASEASSNPERIYKVVFIGDSGVGKSSFIHRFCHNDFRSTFSATIGVDFQVKSINVDGHFVALQLWDTAGQERFRSITKQYYRKADGVIIMFDITSENSFKNIMEWMHDVKEGSDESTVLMVIGNKTDLCVREEARVIKGRDGERLADEYGALYFETSAKLGDGIEDSILAMAVLLQQREDETIERCFRLQETANRKRKCCKN